MTADTFKSWYDGLLPDSSDNFDYAHVFDPLLQKLFRIFLLLSERSLKKVGVKSAPWIHVDEIKFLVLILNRHLPAVHTDKSDLYGFYDYDSTASGLLQNVKCEHKFKEFAILLSKLFPYTREEFLTAVLIVYDHLINQVLKKGFLLLSSRKPGGLFHTWQRHWVIVKPGVILLYKNQDETEKLKELFLSATNSFEVKESNCSPNAKRCPLFEFIMKEFDGKARYFATFDVLQRRQWLAALEYASRIREQQPSVPSANIHRQAFLKRRENRILGLSTNLSQTFPRNASHVSTNGISTMPKSDFVGAENRSPVKSPQENFNAVNGHEECRNEEEAFWKNLTVEALCKELRKERLRANRLAVENKRLQDCLQKEQQAIKDEEIVRCLATRLLDEEKRKSTTLEEINQLRGQELVEERKRRENLESIEKSRCHELEQLKDQLLNLQSKISFEIVHSEQSPMNKREELWGNMKRTVAALMDIKIGLKSQILQQQLEFCQEFDQAMSMLSEMFKNK